eukprot:CAMPEP_0170542604 /NCGR_PEP_ID=MMETSP0211-20121228/1978_1 /TAXON_ID=311385 /ORGANISM="Pseudokeronopsis sp., Strain OXSARD2" /LENGTH=100 /DNA_ID=CAMNT_0010845713 /DNA_START=131 /DNA_END=433 /DNA_ORIENTATION=-
MVESYLKNEKEDQQKIVGLYESALGGKVDAGPSQLVQAISDNLKQGHFQEPLLISLKIPKTMQTVQERVVATLDAECYSHVGSSLSKVEVENKLKLELVN